MTNKSEKKRPVKQKKSKVNKKALVKETLGIDIANNAAAKRRKVENKNTLRKVNNIEPKRKKEKPKSKKNKAISYSLYMAKKSIFKVILAIVIITLIIGAVVVINNRHKLGITLKTEVNKTDSILIHLATGKNEIFSYQKELLVYSRGTVRTYNEYGKKTWEYKFDEMFTPKIETNGKYLQITNADNGYIYVFENKYEVARIKVNGNIDKASINKNGETSVLYGSLGAKAVIGVYSKKGKETYSTKLSNANVTNFKLSDNSKYLVYTEVIMQGISVTENINIVDTSKSNSVKTVKTMTSEMVYRLDIKGQNIDIVTDIAVYRYNMKNGKTIEEKIDNRNIIYVDYADKYLALLSKKADNEAKSQLIIKNIENDKEKVVNIDDVPKDFKYSNYLAYVVFQKQIEVYNNFGKNVKVYKSDNIILNIQIFNNGKSIAIPYSSEIEIINI